MRTPVEDALALLGFDSMECLGGVPVHRPQDPARERVIAARWAAKPAAWRQEVRAAMALLNIPMQLGLL